MNTNKMDKNLPNSGMPGPQDCVVGGFYRIIKKIGGNTSAEIYHGEICANAAAHVAIKLETNQLPQTHLAHEHKVYQDLGRGPGIPNIYYYGEYINYNIMVMELLGPSLEDLFELCNRRFSTKTIIMLANQMITRMEFLHSRKYIHRDISPENFLMGIGHNCNTLFLIDYGHSKNFIDSKTGMHIECTSANKLVGTVRYASLNSQMGLAQSRRDDMESLGYLMMYFNRGQLPWQGIQAATYKQKYEKILERKMSVSIEALCEGYPGEFGSYLKYCRGLKFLDRPKYTRLSEMFQTLFRNLNCKNDCRYDWTMLTQKDINEALARISKKNTGDKYDKEQEIHHQQLQFTHQKFMGYTKKVPLAGKPKPIQISDKSSHIQIVGKSKHQILTSSSSTNHQKTDKEVPHRS